MTERSRTARRILGLVDLTDLDAACTQEDVDQLCKRAVGQYGKVAAVCVWPSFVARAARNLEGEGVAIATVVNFPGGDDDQVEITALIAQCISDGADEIDMVLPYRDFLAGRFDEVGRTLDAARAVIPESVHFKVILETGELSASGAIERAARFAVSHGADFLKSSTGKTPVSATPQSVRILLEVAADSIRPVGVKASGGIRTLDDASAYLDIADEIMGPTWVSTETFRFGASGLLDALEAEIAAATSQ